MGEWGNGGMEEWSIGGMEYWRNGGMGEWRNGVLEEWSIGVMEECLPDADEGSVGEGCLPEPDEGGAGLPDVDAGGAGLPDVDAEDGRECWSVGKTCQGAQYLTVFSIQKDNKGLREPKVENLKNGQEIYQKSKHAHRG